MGGRDVLILAAVLLVGGFAVADSLRGEGTPTRPEARETTTAAATTAPNDVQLGRRKFPPLPGVGGSVVFTDAEGCAVREVALPGGDELPNVVRSSSCELWPAPVTAKIAVGIGASSRDAVPFRFVDLAHPSRNLGGYRALFGFIIWSPDGQRAAWCGASRTGFDLELGRAARRLPHCPAAYTPLGEIAYALGERLVVEERTALRASGGITLARFGEDGSTAVVVEGRRIERYVDGDLAGELDLSGGLEGRVPAFSPDNCAALFRAGERVRLVDVGCSPHRSRSFPGTAAAWSPDGEWVAVAERGTIAFYRLGEDEPVVRWPAGASQLFWRG
jgi:hypothetical protein